MSEFREWHLETQHLGRRVLVYDTIDSTSSRCAEFTGDERHHGMAVLARAQTAGRGQYGRSWLCEPGMGILLSVLLFPPRELSRPAILTTWAAVSVCELIREISGLEAQIKWPNDVLIDGRKVCGILIEQNRGVVVGVGLNLNQSREDFQSAGLTEAASLNFFTRHPHDVEETARRLLHQLDQEFHQLIQGNVVGLESRWRQRLGLLEKKVVLEGHQEFVIGWPREISFSGVVVECENGVKLLFPPEKIKHIRPTS